MKIRFFLISLLLSLFCSIAYADCTQNTACTKTYPPGTTVTLTAAPNPGSVFVKWTGDVCNGSKNKVCTFVMPVTPVNVQAEFKQLSKPTNLRVF